ncbi:FeoB small GTPase domain-containing protein [Bacteroidota bacterium]
MEKFEHVIALTGNPNTGKSTIFNNLTGLRQHTGNWPGKTVSRAEGGYKYESEKYKVVDLPGTYSLLSTSVDEEIARDFILFGEPDVTVIVVDATLLERNLNLVLQIMEITDKVIMALNMMDEARRKNISINYEILSKDLGIPVILTEARKKVGMENLLRNISDVVSDRYICKPKRISNFSDNVEKAISLLSKSILHEYPNLPNVRWVAIRLMEGDQSIINALRKEEIKSI